MFKTELAFGPPYKVTPAKEIATLSSPLYLSILNCHRAVSLNKQIKHGTYVYIVKHLLSCIPRLKSKFFPFSNGKLKCEVCIRRNKLKFLISFLRHLCAQEPVYSNTKREIQEYEIPKRNNIITLSK